MVANPLQRLGASEMDTERMGTDAAIPGTNATFLLIFVFSSWRRNFNPDPLFTN